MQRRAWSSALVSVVGVSVLGLSGLGLASPAAAEPAPTGPGATQVADEREPLTPEQVKAQLAQAQELREQLEHDDAALAEASRELAELAATSNELMNEVTAARAAEAEAKKTEEAEVAELKRLTAEVAAAKEDLDDMAVDAYVNGPGMLRELAGIVDFVARGGQDSEAAQKADFLAKARSADQQHFAELAQQQQEAAAAAAKARTEREAATAKAEEAQQAVAEAVAEQQEAIAQLQQVADDRRTELEALGVDSGVFAGVDLEALGAVATTPLCTDVAGSYPNGRWPGTALCPIDDQPGHMLQPEASRSFNALNDAYEKAWGTNLCVTDSYRSYASQVDVRARKPNLAAVPGTSNHGLGLALDLCGGIENFGTPQHVWMQQNAPLFGWFHPGWAQASGSKPEPWHWEFATG